MGTEQLIERDKLRHEELKVLEPRLQRLEKELEGVKAKMEKRKQTRTKGFKWFR